MANLQTINIGNRVNDGLGDDLRTAFQKVNANFADLNDELTVTVTNVGTTGVGVFKQKVGSNLEFKSLVAGRKITLSDQVDSIVVNNTASDAFEKIHTQSGMLDANAYQSITVAGAGNGRNVITSASGGALYIDTVMPVTHILSYYDFGLLNGNYTNSVQVAMQAANIDFGTLTYVGRLDVDCGSLL